MAHGLVDYLRELAEPFGDVTFKRMFGGWAVMGPNGMFGLVAADVFYLKSDAETDGLFEAEGLECFGYAGKSGRFVRLPYRRAPERIYDDPDEFRAWCLRARAVADRAADRKAAPNRRRPADRRRERRGGRAADAGTDR